MRSAARKSLLSKLTVLCCSILTLPLSEACTETCGRSLFLFSRYTLCNAEKHTEICSPFPRLRLNRGYTCGACEKVEPTETIVQCPIEGKIQKLTNYQEDTPLKVRNSMDDSLCALFLVSESGKKIPVARSYLGNDWEAYAGQYSHQAFTCNSSVCETTLPALSTEKKNYLGSYHFEITSFQHSIPEKDQVARFLEQTTFGPTVSEIELFPGSFAAWVQQQQEIPLSSHRAFYREHLNNRYDAPTPMGIPTHACDKGTRYRKYAITSDSDRKKKIEIKTDQGTGRKIILVDGAVRTSIDATVLYAGSPDDNMVYQDGMYFSCGVSNGVGNKFRLIHPTAKCKDVYTATGKLGNPAIFFDDKVPPPQAAINLQNYAVPVNQQYFPGNDDSQELFVETKLDDVACDSFPEVTGVPLFPVIGQYGGEYWLHDPRFDLYENTKEAPKSDGGSAIVEATHSLQEDVRARPLCFSAPMTFLNEDDGCYLTSDPNACGGSVVDRENTIELTTSNFQRVHDASGGERFIYAVTGLRQVALDVPYSSPCTPRTRSRWVRVGTNECSSGLPAHQTLQVFASLMVSSRDTNPFVRDVYLPALGAICDSADQEAYNFRILVGSECWQNVHQQHFQVYDFSNWVKNHPGGAVQIKQFAEVSKNFVLSFPESHFMDRFHDNVGSLTDLGRLGDEVQISGSSEAAESFQAILPDPSIVHSAVVCGSPFEVANKKDNYGVAYYGSFDALRAINQTSSLGEYYAQKVKVWMDIALRGKDQLRQRIAWTLSQILVVSEDSVGESSATERFMAYYDIFVRHAFGNYRDILKEVSYSPLMAQMLSFLGSRSTAFLWHKQKDVLFADENYAREIMQLFSIGLNLLNNDGTMILDSSGNPIPTYSNDDITEYARLWTGFESPAKRGNIEVAGAGSRNRIDPMSLNSKTRDNFPKMGLNGWYVGDGMPLCSDLPKRHFLKKGATYRLLGSSPSPRLLNEPDEWATREGVRRVFLRKDSALYEKICNKESPNNKSCRYQSKLVLDVDLPCTGTECDIDAPRVVEVEAGLFYEYSRMPCANQAFYDNAKLMQRVKQVNYYCEDPRMEVGGISCCKHGSNDAIMSLELFEGEQMTFASAKARCLENNLEVCESPSIDCNGCDRNLGHWTSQPCDLMTKIDLEGKVAVVHSSTHEKAKDKFSWEVQEDTKTFFRADWSGSIDQMLLSNYDSKCAEMGCLRDSFDNLCLCPTSVSETQAFTRAPSKQEVLRDLHIGYFHPSAYDKEFQTQDLGSGVLMHSTDGLISDKSIFEVVDENGITHLRKNVKSTVSLGNGPLSFRNPPNLMSVVNPEPRDGHYEIDAGLDHYFYHQNTAPFLAVRFAQRFGISNPSPRYIAVMANAFRTGRFDDFDTGFSFGSGAYGDIGAMVAAMLLDREARSEVLDVDPVHGSIQEPFLKVVRVMRSLEFETATDRPLINFGSGLSHRIGQEAHELPDVFSFFLPEYSPPGAFADGGLACPECFVLTGPRTIELVNGLTSLVKYGLDKRYGGIGSGRSGWGKARIIGHSRDATGNNTYLPDPEFDSVEVIDELVRVLTSGRILQEKRTALVEVYEEALSRGATKEAFINVQQLILMSPEFHTNTLPKNNKEVQLPEEPAQHPPLRPYKAVIHINLAGGMDSYNMLVPHKCSGTNTAGVTVDEQYKQERGSMAFTDNERSLLIDVHEQWGQPCSVFALHDEMTLLKELYDAGDLAFFANTGVLGSSDSTRADYKDKTKIKLFAHNTMGKATKEVDTWAHLPGTGVLGRFGTVLAKKGFRANAMSIDSPSVLLESETDSAGPNPLIVSRSGAKILGEKPDGEALDVNTYVNKLNAPSQGYSSLLGDTWSKKFAQGVHDSVTLKSNLDSADELGPHWPKSQSRLGQQLSMISQLVNTRQMRGIDRDFFSANMGGWDHHANMKSNLRDKFNSLNEDLRLLVEELKFQGVWDDVVIVVASEFGRTITPNGRQGTDHGWGGHYWIMGGSVDGTKILGQYPSDITPEGPLNVGRGRMIPTTSWDAVWSGVGEWLGADSEEDKNYCLPTRQVAGNGFTELFSQERLFKNSDRRHLRADRSL